MHATKRTCQRQTSAGAVVELLDMFAAVQTGFGSALALFFPADLVGGWG